MHTCYRRGMYCWGRNDYGQIGDGTTVSPRLTAVAMPGMALEVTAISSGLDHTCAMKGSSSMNCWGRNDNGLGDGTTTTPRATAVDVANFYLYIPSQFPTSQPSSQPTRQPSIQPSSQPTSQPSCQPSYQPNTNLSAAPSTQPTTHPSLQPTGQPSHQPSSHPSHQGTLQPSVQPSVQCAE